MFIYAGTKGFGSPALGTQERTSGDPQKPEAAGPCPTRPLPVTPVLGSPAASVAGCPGAGLEPSTPLPVERQLLESQLPLQRPTLAAGLVWDVARFSGELQPPLQHRSKSTECSARPDPSHGAAAQPLSTCGPSCTHPPHRPCVSSLHQGALTARARSQSCTGPGSVSECAVCPLLLTQGWAPGCRLCWVLGRCLAPWCQVVSSAGGSAALDRGWGIGAVAAGQGWCFAPLGWGSGSAW